MAVQAFSIEIQAVNLHKFGVLKSGMKPTPDKLNSINIVQQAHEISVFESIFSPVMKCEIAVFDYIGLFTNFPLTGEEIIDIRYKNVGDDIERSWIMAITGISDIVIEDKNRATGFLISGSSIEIVANLHRTVQKAYKDTTPEIAKTLFQEFITDGVKKFFPNYISPPFITENNDTVPMKIVIPNVHPFAAIDMLQMLSYSEVMKRYTYLFYQNSRGFHFKTLQGITSANNSRRKAFKNSYKYLSDEIDENRSDMNNNIRVISKLEFNKRHSTAQKVSTGYFNNNLFEINIAQKAVHSTRSDRNMIETIEANDFNTDAYKDWADSAVEGDEYSNRTKYAVTTRPEHDQEYPVSRVRERWGKDLIARTALSQIDVTVVIPGTNEFVAGDLFFLEIPETHGFNDNEIDDLVSGFYVITEVKQLIRIGGYQSTVLRINKDSYKNSPNRPSRYT